METVVDGIFSNQFWYIAPVIVSLVTTGTAYINKWLHVEQKWIKQAVSWILASGLSVAVWALKLLVFGPPVWVGVVTLAVVTGLSSNGFYDIGVIKAFVKNITGQQ